MLHFSFCILFQLCVERPQKNVLPWPKRKRKKRLDDMKEPDPRWALVDLLLRTAFLLMVILGLISFVGHSIRIGEVSAGLLAIAHLSAFRRVRNGFPHPLDRS